VEFHRIGLVWRRFRETPPNIRRRGAEYYRCVQTTPQSKKYDDILYSAAYRATDFLSLVLVEQIGEHRPTVLHDSVIDFHDIMSMIATRCSDRFPSAGIQIHTLVHKAP